MSGAFSPDHKIMIEGSLVAMSNFQAGEIKNTGMFNVVSCGTKESSRDKVEELFADFKKKQKETISTENKSNRGKKCDSNDGSKATDVKGGCDLVAIKKRFMYFFDEGHVDVVEGEGKSGARPKSAKSGNMLDKTRRCGVASAGDLEPIFVTNFNRDLYHLKKKLSVRQS